MLIDLRTVAPGDLPNEVFDEFIAGNDYSPGMVAALRAHLVKGLEIKQAVAIHEVAANKFKMRLEKPMKEIQKVGRINALLSSDPARLEQVFALAASLATAVDQLRSNHSE